MALEEITMDAWTESRQALTSALTDAALSAGAYLRQQAYDHGGIEWKKENDPVTKADNDAETIVRHTLAKHLPMNYVGEEQPRADNNADLTAYIDSIDGTKSFVLREFISALSIGVEQEGRLVGGCVYDFMRDILYVGAYGDAHIVHNGHSVPFMTQQVLSKPRISVDNPYDEKAALPDWTMTGQYKLSPTSGSVALTMAQAAAGTFQGMICKGGKGNVWDVAGGAYLLQATGHILTDREGQPFDHHNANKGFVALHPSIALEAYR